MKDIIIATHNQHKFEEISPLMPAHFKLNSLTNIGFHTPIEEPFDTLEANAEIKARTIYNQYKSSCFADDTGLEVEALDGAPGVFSARYAGQNCSYQDNVNKLLKAMKGQQNRNARFRTVIALIMDGKTHFFEGMVHGKITEKPMGSDGFGYDPIFIPQGCNESFAQMPLSVKNNMSHRAKAVEKLVHFLKKC